ncbi:MAG TPA: protein translocase subunit SecF [Candidatus Acidoferrales bacterium]|nr:protein translocase subunit SecF [Candidatus Acidoferrales bacterium]
MEFFHGVNINWMKWTKYFIALSLLLLAIGWISVLRNHGLRYGIDFRGGTLVYVRFSGPPPMNKIRSGLQNAGLANSTIQLISDISDPSSKNDVVIGLEQEGQNDQALDAGKQLIVNVLHKTFGSGVSGKVDFNTVSASSLSAYLTQKDPLSLGVTAGERYNQLAQRLVDARDKDHGGIITNFDELKSVDGATPAVLASLNGGFSPSNFAIRNVDIVGPKVGSQLRRQALLATLYALLGMLVYIAFRFEWVYGAAAVIAVFHDVLITLGFFSIFHYEISLTVIAALLTLVGYSMNDTIVIFDRVRENLKLMRRESFEEIVNTSINQTLSRTILTSGLTFLTVLVLFLMGGEVLRSFSFAMVIGVVVGTYSSFGIAAPIVVFWNKHWGQGATPARGKPASAASSRTGSAADKRVVAAARR